MRASILTTAFVITLSLPTLSGCDQSSATQDSSSVAPQAPDTPDVDVGVRTGDKLPPAGGAIDVDSDPVDVKVGGGEGIQIDATGVDLKIGGGHGVDVNVDKPSQ